MPRIIIIIFTCIIFLEGCKSPLEKFIFTPLTTQELDQIVKTDKSFLNTYSIIEEKSNKTFSSSDSAKYKQITYLRLHNYLKQITNKDINSTITSDARADWLSKYNRYNSAVDSIIKQWENYLNNNSPQALCSVNYIGYSTEKVRVNNKIIENIRLKFKLKALKFSLDSVYANYTLADSTYFNDTLPGNRFTTYPFNYTRILRDSIVTSIIHNQLPTDNSSYNSNLKDTNKFILTGIESVFANNKCYNTDSLRKEIPYNVLSIIDGRNSTQEYFDETIYRDFIIKEFIDSAFPSQEAFVGNCIENYHKTLDTLVYSYIHYNQL